MSAMKRMVENIVELWWNGMDVENIAKTLCVSVDIVVSVVEEYSEA
jgi:orotate phosphoribosyltransferase-like protein